MTGRPKAWAAGLAAVFLAAVLVFGALPLGAQTIGPSLPGTEARDSSSSLDYSAWEQMASRVETAIEARASASSMLEELRSKLVDWREALLGAQNANSARIATLRTQIAALGPAPTDGVAEPAAIAERRSILTEQLVRLQAPGIAADEAYQRADGLIREIDRALRERQANEILKAWPAPIYPANWPEAVIALTDTGIQIWDEFATSWASRFQRAELRDNLPIIATLMLVALVLTFRGRRGMAHVSERILGRVSARARRIASLILSLVDLVLPVIGVLILVVALSLTSLPGPIGNTILDSLLLAALPAILGSWIAGRVFAPGPEPEFLQLSEERRAEGRYLSFILGVLMGIETLRFAAMDAQSYSEGATSVLSFPMIALSGLVVWRLGHLLRRHARSEAAVSEAASYANRLIGLIGRGAIVLGIAGPVVGALGYVAGAAAVVYPAALSLALVGFLLILQRLVVDAYGFFTGRADGGKDALLPVLISFGLTLLALPVFALIWGARIVDLAELWTRFREGFYLGTTRISPTEFFLFGVIFALGYGLTRLFQGALRTSILPRTKLDQGGQNAIVSGVGYIGLFLAGLIAIRSAGIDLSGLAIVAGALSLGIGFGLQTIVSNFVSGVILLIERPVSEGDWIEVGNVQGIVKSISVRSTRIQTFDRSDVIVPNSDLITGRVTNWTRFNLTGRLIVPVAVPFGTDSRKVERILREIVEAQPMAVLSPPPIIAFTGFGAETMIFEIRVILRDVNFTLNVRSDINHEIAKRFAAAGIDFSQAARDFRLRDTAALAPTVQVDEVAAQDPAPRRAKGSGA
jgi:potassium-dependent mechanosensitive channel